MNDVKIINEFPCQFLFIYFRISKGILKLVTEFRSSSGETASKTGSKLLTGQYNQSAVSKRFLLAVSPLELLNLTDYEEKKGTARSLLTSRKGMQLLECELVNLMVG